MIHFLRLIWDWSGVVVNLVMINFVCQCHKAKLVKMGAEKQIKREIAVMALGATPTLCASTR